MIMHICKNCGNEFVNFKHKESSFCSRECYLEYIKTHKEPLKIGKKVKVECAECHKIEYVNHSRAKKYRCCSIECMGKHASKTYSKKVELICPICGEHFFSKKSAINKHKTCGKPECSAAWRKIINTGKGNPNYRKVELDLMSQGSSKVHDISKTEYQHVVKEILHLSSVKKIPKGYLIHHKDGNHANNKPNNLVVIPKTAHRLIHSWFGNVLINALHTGKINDDLFFSMCNDEQKEFYKNIIDLDITKQVVVKQGELLGQPDEANQQLSIYRNIYESSTTNSRDLTDNAEVGNADMSALPTFQKSSYDIV